jgi:hypothetical protein
MGSIRVLGPLRPPIVPAEVLDGAAEVGQLGGDDLRAEAGAAHLGAHVAIAVRVPALGAGVESDVHQETSVEAAPTPDERSRIGR